MNSAARDLDLTVAGGNFSPSGELDLRGLQSVTSLKEKKGSGHG
jgi:hypothetical protein